MSGVVSGTGFQSTLEPPSQDLRSRDISKSSRITSTLSGARRSPSPSASQSHGLLSKDASSSHVTRLSPPVGQFVINTLLQIAGFVAAIAFGIYAVQSVKVGKDANQWADIANQLALLDLCMSSDNQVSFAKYLLHLSVTRIEADHCSSDRRHRIYLFSHSLSCGYRTT